VGAPSGYRPQILGAFPVLTVHENHVYVGIGDTYEIRMYTRDGEPFRVLRLDRPGQPVTPAIRSQWDQFERARIRQLGMLSERSSERAFATILPQFRQFLVDADGNLWVEDYRLPWEEGSLWITFDSSGALLGEVTVPSGMRLIEIGPQQILAAKEWDEQSTVVSIHRLVSSRAP